MPARVHQRHDTGKFLRGQHVRRNSRFTRIREEEGGLLITPIDPGSEDGRHEPPNDSAHTGRLGLWKSECPARIDAGANAAEGIIDGRSGRVQAGVQQSDERELGTVQSVADRSLAATGIPTQQTPVGQPQASQGVVTLGEGDILRKNLNHIVPALPVQNVRWTPQKVSKGLATPAVAHHSVSEFRPTDMAFDGSASTLQRVLQVFVLFPFHGNPLQCVTGSKGSFASSPTVAMTPLAFCKTSRA